MIGLDILAKTFTLAKAVLCGTNVSQERLKKRLEICSGCDKVEQSGKLMRCGICQCTLAEKGLINLARYVEDADGAYGCKHPDGSKWKEQGV